MIGRLWASEELDGRQRRPDLVVHLQLFDDDNTTTRLLAFRDDRRRTPPSDHLGGVLGGLPSNASSRRRGVDLDSVQASSVTQQEYDGKGLELA